MTLTLLEQEVVDTLAQYERLTAFELRKILEWSSAKLQPILAVLQEKQAIGVDQQLSYPKETFYFVPKT